MSTPSGQFSKSSSQSTYSAQNRKREEKPLTMDDVTRFDEGMLIQECSQRVALIDFNLDLCVHHPLA